MPAPLLVKPIKKSIVFPIVKTVVGVASSPTPDPDPLLDDQFAADLSAPLTSPRSANPGPGTLTLVQTDGQFSVSSGKLVVPARTTPAVWGGLGFHAVGSGGAISREAGRMLLGKITPTVTNQYSLPLGWAAAAAVPGPTDLQIGLRFNATSGLLVNYLTVQNFTTPYTYSANERDYAFVLRSTGSWLFAKGDGITDWTLVNVENVSSGATVYPALSQWSSPFTLDDLLVPEFTWSPTALTSGAVTAGNTVDLGSADATIEYVMTDTVASQRGYFRYVDAANHWYWEQTGTTIILYSVESSVATSRGSISRTHPGAAYTINIRLLGTSIVMTTSINNAGLSKYLAVTSAIHQSATRAGNHTSAGMTLNAWATVQPGFTGRS